MRKKLFCRKNITYLFLINLFFIEVVGCQKQTVASCRVALGYMEYLLKGEQKQDGYRYIYFKLSDREKVSVLFSKACTMLDRDHILPIDLAKCVDISCQMFQRLQQHNHQKKIFSLKQLSDITKESYPKIAVTIENNECFLKSNYNDKMQISRDLLIDLYEIEKDCKVLSMPNKELFIMATLCGKKYKIDTESLDRACKALLFNRTFVFLRLLKKTIQMAPTAVWFSMVFSAFAIILKI